MTGASKNPSHSENRRVALITGAARGIGAATALALARRGYKLVLADIADLQTITRKLESEGSSFQAIATDVRRNEDLQKLAREALARFGRVDALIHNAGVVHTGLRVSNLTDDIISDVIGTNLLAPIQLTRYLLPSMLERRSGFIGFVASVGGHVALPTAAIYSTSKFGLRGFAAALRREVMQHGIKVTVISPGFVATQLIADIRYIVRKLHLPELPAERVAREIVRSINNPRREVIVPGYYRAFTWFERNLPAVVDLVSSRVLPHIKDGSAKDRP